MQSAGKSARKQVSEQDRPAMVAEARRRTSHHIPESTGATRAMACSPMARRPP
jgi:hypothetical protein